MEINDYCSVPLDTCIKAGDKILRHCYTDSHSGKLILNLRIYQIHYNKKKCEQQRKQQTQLLNNMTPNGNTVYALPIKIGNNDTDDTENINYQ